MALILEKTDQVTYFTDMCAVLAAAGIAPQAYDWYVSDIATNWNPPGFLDQDQWMTGEVLADLLAHAIQFDWAVFSAVPKGFRPVIDTAPFADGNPDFWRGKTLMPQLEGALFEIVCWDSSATILINLPIQAKHRFMRTYPDTRSLYRA